jgi:hypothetical protein
MIAGTVVIHPSTYRGIMAHLTPQGQRKGGAGPRRAPHDREAQRNIAISPPSSLTVLNQDIGFSTTRKRIAFSW